MNTLPTTNGDIFTLDRVEYFLKMIWRLGLVSKAGMQESYSIAWNRYV